MVHQPSLQKSDVVRLLRSKRGSIAEVALLAKVGRTAVSHWMAGMSTSANVANCAERIARKIAKATDDANGPSVRSKLPELRTKAAPQEES